MKSKRQTIWLVSMLSLMVVLSAYYLFTEDSATNKPKTADGKQVATMEQTTSQTVLEGSALSDDDIIVSEVTAEDEAVQDMLISEEQADPNDKGADVTKNEPAKNEEAAENAKKNDQPEATDHASESVKDEDVLKKLESEGTLTRDSLTAYQMDRAEQNTKKQEQLLQTMSDDKKTLDEAAMAQQQLDALEEKEAKITDIEERLQQQYANAVVTEDNDSYRVVVISEKLQVEEAVDIVDLVIKELGVSQDKVKVQYVSQ